MALAAAATMSKHMETKGIQIAGKDASGYNFDISGRIWKSAISDSHRFCSCSRRGQVHLSLGIFWKLIRLGLYVWTHWTHEAHHRLSMDMSALGVWEIHILCEVWRKCRGSGDVAKGEISEPA